MKAIVAEIDKKHMIAITEKGDFIKVKRKLSVGIGDEIELKPQNATMVYRRLAAMAACLLVAVFMTTGVYAYYTPCSYVSMDINPSVALTLNRFDRVISVDPLTDDAVKFIEDTKSLKNQEVNVAVTEIIKSASEKGYINSESESQVVVVVSAKNPKQENQIINEVSAAAEGELAKVSKDYDVMIEKTSVSSYKAAVSNKVSPGKEILAGKLKEFIPELKDEEIRNMSVKDTVKLIKEGRKALISEKRNRDDEEADDSKVKDWSRNKGKDEEKGNGKAAAENKGGKAKSDSDVINGAATDSRDSRGNGANGNGKAVITSNKEDDDDADKGEDEDKDKEKDKEKDKNDKGNGKDIKGHSNGQNNGTNGRENNKDDNSNNDDEEDDNGDTGKDNGNNKNNNGKNKKGGKNSG